MAILNLFRESKPWITIEDIAAALGVSAPSAYRYASELMQGGLLSRAAGRYRLGPKIIELEYLIRTYDPIIQAAHKLMHGLAELTECDVLLCNVYDQTVINVFHVPGRQPLKLTYTKGLPMPLFRGSQAHVILAHMDRRKLRRIYDTAMADPAQAADAAQIGEDWTAFSKELKRIRAAGHYVSRGELDADVVGIAAPVFGEQQEILGSLVLSMRASTPPPISEEMLVGMVMQCANEITKRIGQEGGAAA
jgi:DNA-binding IclR family transcriptional regulator